MINFSKHTPGPWRISGDLVFSADETFNHPGAGGAVATVLRYGETRPTDANARLIAAAPEMYESLLLLRQLWDNAQIPTEFIDNFANLMPRICVVIEKVQGVDK